MRRADIEVPNRVVAVDARTRLACYPRSKCYSLNPGAPTCNQGVTKARFRDCSACRPRSKAGFCLCTLQGISIPLEPTFALLRYPLAGNRPSLTARHALSLPYSPKV